MLNKIQSVLQKDKDLDLKESWLITNIFFGLDNYIKEDQSNYNNRPDGIYSETIFSVETDPIKEFFNILDDELKSVLNVVELAEIFPHHKNTNINNKQIIKLCFTDSEFLETLTSDTKNNLLTTLISTINYITDEFDLDSQYVLSYIDSINDNLMKYGLSYDINNMEITNIANECEK